MKAAQHNQNPMYGLGKHYGKVECERLFRQLVVSGVLHEDLQIGAHEQAICYLKTGKLAPDVLSGKHIVSYTK